MRIAVAAALTALLLVASIASADLYQGRATSGDASRPRASIRTTGRSTSREEYRGSLATTGALPHLRFTDVVKGTRTTCRADVRFTFNSWSQQ